jgi:uncharacterized protein HemY
MRQQTAHTAVVEDDFTRGRRVVDQLDRAISLLEGRFGESRDMRQVRIDLNRLRESLALLQAAAAAQRRGDGSAAEESAGRAAG